MLKKITPIPPKARQMVKFVMFRRKGQRVMVYFPVKSNTLISGPGF